MSRPTYARANIELGLIKVLNGNQQGLVFLLNSELTSIGRDIGCDIQIQDPSCSRIQCRIVRDDQGYLLRDTESYNGTLVGVERVETARLAAGDVIKIGKTKLKFDLCAAVPYEDSGVVMGASGPMRPINSARPEMAEFNREREFFTQAIELCKKGQPARLLLMDFLRLVSSWLGTTSCLAFVVNDGKTDLASVLLSEPPIVGRDPIRYLKSAISTAMDTGQPQTEYFRLNFDVLAPDKYPVIGAMAVPVIAGSSTYAIVYVDTLGATEDRFVDFTPSQITLLASVCAMVGQQVHLRTVDPNSEKLKRHLQVGELLSLASHRISNRLQVINNGSFLVDTGIQSDDQELVYRGWEMMRQNQTLLGTLTKNLISFCRDFEPMPKEHDLCVLVDEAISNVSDGFDINFIDLHHQNPAQCRARVDQYATIQAVENLLSIALSESKEGRNQYPISVTTSVTSDHAVVTLAFQQFSEDFDLEGMLTARITKSNAENDMLAALVSQRQILNQGGTLRIKVDSDGRNELVIQFRRPCAEDSSRTTDAVSDSESPNETEQR